MSKTLITLPDMIDAAAARRPDKAALISGERRVTYGEIGAFAGAVASILRSRGLAAGDRVAIKAGNKIDFLRGVIGAMASGAVAAPIDEAGAAGQAALIDHLEPRFVLHDGSLSVDPGAFADCTFLVFDDIDALASQVPSSPTRVTDSESIALILHTSGTEGGRKGVMLSHANLSASTQAINQFMGVTADIVEVVTAPVDHAFGFGRCRCVLAAGGTVIADEGLFNPLRVLASLRRHEANALSSVSTGIAMLVGHMADALAECAAHVRWMEIGSLPLGQAAVDWLCATFPEARIAFNYGMTEGMRSTLVDLVGETAGRDSVGRAAPGCAVRVCGENGETLAPGTAGTIEVSGPHIAVGYWRDASAWAARIEDGWFRSDDIGTLDAAGYLRFIGRRDDLINCGGEKLSPTDIELSIQPHLTAIPFCVLGICDPAGLYGEVPALCVEGDWPAEVDWQTLRTSLAEVLPGAFVPRVAAAVPTFPRTGNGKVRRRDLRSRIESGQGVALQG
jgi:long-chain acyl-CoA synthetase